MPERADIEIAFGQKTLRGWFYIPEESQPWPAVVMAHGFSGVKEQRLGEFAEAFAERGMAVCVIDFPNLGASNGEPRGDIDPAEQLEAFRATLDWTAARKGVDPDRIGIWGTSYSGGHVLSLASSAGNTIKCAVAQVPFVGPPMDEIPAPLEAMFASERDRTSGSPSMVPVVGEGFAALPTPDAKAWAEALAPDAPTWRNEVTLASVDRLLHYRPADNIENSAVPLLIVLALNDSLIPASMVRAVFERAGGAKKLVEIESGHFDVYLDRFDDAVQPEADWLSKHLA